MQAAEAPGAAILIAAYNAEQTLARAIHSALAEPEVREVCVIDDCSTDSTLALARSCDDGSGRLIVLSQDKNAGPSAARNKGLERISAEWVGILDADDYLLPGRIGRMLAHAGEADFIADALLRRLHPGEIPAPNEPALEAGGPTRRVDFAEFVEGNLGRAGHGADLGFVKPLMRRAFLIEHAMRYQPQMRLGEDYEFYARALALGARFLMIPPAGYISVDRPGSLSNRHAIEDLRQLRDCDAALGQLRPMSAAETRALRQHAESINCRLQWRLLIEAVKARDLKAAFATFETPRVALYLALQLLGQVWARSLGRVFAPQRQAEA